MLGKWLNCCNRDPQPYTEFAVFDATHLNTLDEDDKAHLCQLLTSTRFDADYIASMANILGWSNVQSSILSSQMPTQTSVRRGDFGEMLIGAILEEFLDYKIPISKLRYKVTKNQLLTGTDLLAIRLNESDEIIEVCLIESKLRTQLNSKTVVMAVTAYEQLEKDYAESLPAILQFISARLHEQKSTLFKPFAEYMRDRNDNREKDKFNISLCWDAAAWDEKILENLKDRGVDLSGLVVHCIHLQDLGQLTDELFTSLGITEVVDDDE